MQKLAFRSSWAMCTYLNECRPLQLVEWATLVCMAFKHAWEGLVLLLWLPKCVIAPKLPQISKHVSEWASKWETEWVSGRRIEKKKHSYVGAGGGGAFYLWNTNIIIYCIYLYSCLYLFLYNLRLDVTLYIKFPLHYIEENHPNHPYMSPECFM